MRKLCFILLVSLWFFSGFAQAQDDSSKKENCNDNLENSCLSDKEKYLKALKDTAIIEPHEKEWLQTIDVTQPKIVVLTLKESECSSFVDKDSFKKRDVWMFLPSELRRVYQSKLNEFANREDRLKKLIGLKYDKSYKCLIELEVSSNQLIRPSFFLDIKGDFQKEKEGEESFWQIWAKGLYPFTALGYTCDWYYGDGCRYGLTEFFIKKGNDSVITKACTIDDYLEEKCPEFQK